LRTAETEAAKEAAKKAAKKAEKESVSVDVEVTDESGETLSLPSSLANVRAMPCGDELDKMIGKLGVPAVGNFIIGPLVGAVDTFWVGRMDSAVALAGLGAANQVFSSVFSATSFLPSVVTPLVAKSYASGNMEGVRARVREAIFVSVVIGILMTFALTAFPRGVLQPVIPPSPKGLFSRGPTVMDEAVPYLFYRSVAFIPAMVSFVGFATFRGMLDITTPLQISLFAQMLNVVFDPVFIFKPLGLGAAGAALATAVAEFASAGCYMYLLRKQRLVLSYQKVILQPPSMKSLGPLLKGGAGVGIRSLAMNFAFLAVQRAVQQLDSTGTAAAAHTVAGLVWQIGGVFLYALSSVSSMVTASVLARPASQGGGLEAGKAACDRLIAWGGIAGVFLAGLQLLSLPLVNCFTTVQAVRDAAVAPSIIGGILQIINGLVFSMEGMMQGQQAYRPLALNSIVGCALTMLALKYFRSSLAQIWICYGVFNVIRLAGALRHHYITGPFGRRARRARERGAGAADELAGVSHSAETARVGFWRRISRRRAHAAVDGSHAGATAPLIPEEKKVEQA